MKLREWLDIEVDKTAIRQDADASTENRLRALQSMLSAVVLATQLVDERLEAVESHLGFEVFDIPTQTTRMLGNRRPIDE